MSTQINWSHSLHCRIGKAGGNAAAQSEAISRLISLVLRSGIDPKEVVAELKGISGPTPVWEDGELILSTPDAIGRALERYVQRRGGQFCVVKEKFEEVAHPVEEQAVLRLRLERQILSHHRRGLGSRRGSGVAGFRHVASR